ncbi:hypothetical protein JHK82_051416 [Glycine max]|nr:hypothetical protein JHK82_051416 [Glycine max]
MSKFPRILDYNEGAHYNDIIHELIDKGHFDVVAQEVPHALVDEIPLEATVGLESTFDELSGCFDDNHVGVIGLYGIGGVGKTTQLKKFNNEFLPTKFYDVSIWAVVSRKARNQGCLRRSFS